MNSCLVVKLRPTTPWRIAPDSGARDQTGVLYHSDSLYSAVTHAMRSLGWMGEWLEATADRPDPAVRFSSCFPFLDDELLVAPPRHLWPPPPATRVRWKAARFVPVGVVRTILDNPDARLREDEGWAVDALSGCLLKAGRDGRPRAPFRLGMRRSVAIDRLTGQPSEAFATACLEFAEGAGLWFLAAFRDREAADVWGDRLRSALRLLADSGFGGERSRGWGRAEAPEFAETSLPEFLTGKPVQGEAPASEPTAPSLEVAQISEEPVTPAGPEAPAEPQPPAVEAAPAEIAPVAESAPVEAAAPETPVEAAGEVPVAMAQPEETPPAEVLQAEEPPAGEEPPPVEEPSMVEPAPVEEPPAVEEHGPETTPEPQGLAAEVVTAPPESAPVPAPAGPVVEAEETGYWLLSLFNPSEQDRVDWSRGAYHTVERRGRVESPVRYGEEKRALRMVAEGSVLVSPAALTGRTANVAPADFPHPVYRAGYALAIRISWRGTA